MQLHSGAVRGFANFDFGGAHSVPGVASLANLTKLSVVEIAIFLYLSPPSDSYEISI